MAIKKEDLLKSRGNRPRKGIVKKCKVCNELFYVMPCFIKSAVYCSRKCQHKGITVGAKITLICRNCGNKYKTYQSHIKWRGSSYCSRKCVGEGNTKFRSGKNSNTWKGGISDINRRIRASKKFKEWREAVFKRDNWTCQICGDRSGRGRGKSVILHPHHIKHFAKFKELRFNIDNGKTLCVSCHRLAHKNLDYLIKVCQQLLNKKENY
jgi:hypothetical protein